MQSSELTCIISVRQLSVKGAYKTIFRLLTSIAISLGKVDRVMPG